MEAQTYSAIPGAHDSPGCLCIAQQSVLICMAFFSIPRVSFFLHGMMLRALTLDGGLRNPPGYTNLLRTHSRTYIMYEW